MPPSRQAHRRVRIRRVDRVYPKIIRMRRTSSTIRRQKLSPEVQCHTEQQDRYEIYLQHLEKIGTLTDKLTRFEDLYTGSAKLRKVLSGPSQHQAVHTSDFQDREMDLSKLLEDVDSTLKSWHRKPAASFAPNAQQRVRTGRIQSRGFATNASPDDKDQGAPKAEAKEPDPKTEQQSDDKAKASDDQPKKKKTIEEIDRELQQKMAGHAGDGGEAGVEYENGQPVAMKRSVKDNMFRYI